MQRPCPAEPQLSIVIPVLNDSRDLERLLRLLNTVTPEIPEAQIEVLVVDGGSQDCSVRIAEQQGARVLHSTAGRGLQLNAGCLAARGQWIWLLHADSLPGSEALREMYTRSGSKALTRQTVDWGRFDVCFEERGKMRLTAFMMNWRSRLSGICTGDQGIFLHRRLFTLIGGVPEQPLMEDIELSRRLKRFCRPRCLPMTVQTSARRWQHGGWLATVLTMWRYRLRYWLGAPPEKLAGEYYRRP